MNTNTNNTSTDFRTRLIVFFVVLAVGFAMGWWNGTANNEPNSAGSSGIVAQQQAAPEDKGSDAATSTDESDADTQDDSPVPEDSVEQGTPSSESTTGTQDSGESTVAPTRGPTVEKDGWYTSKEEVALYIHTYKRLPGNFISKTKARERGWVASEGNLDEVCPGMSIGGSRYYDDDGQLPYKRGRQWTECDINYHGGFRGAERIVFSNDGLIFYTGDHYETFERLY